MKTGDLFITPRVRGDGFRASIRGHVLELADPGSSHALAPTPDDLFVVSIASELAWSARGLLRAQGLPDEVDVSATWRAQDDPSSPTDINVNVRVSSGDEVARGALAAGLESSIASRAVVHISLEGAER